MWNNGDRDSMKSHHRLKVKLKIFFVRIGCLYLQEMGWLCHSIDNQPNRIMMPVRPWQACDDVHVNHHPLPSNPLGFWCSTLTCWQCGHLETNSTLSFSMPSHQYTFLKLWYILVKPRWMEYMELLVSSRILSWSLSTLGTYNLTWYFRS